MTVKQTYIEGVYQLTVEGKQRIATVNINPGISVYNEKLITIESKEYRIWDPFRSKFAAAFLSGLKQLPQISNNKILYLGVSTGTTSSHFSDIVGNGIIYGVEFSHRVMREFVKLSKQRQNLIPILGDARKPEEYAAYIFGADVLYQDVAQPDQSMIFGRNAEMFLRHGGKGVLMVKSQSVDVSMEPEEVFNKEASVLEDTFGLKILEMKSIHSFEKKHAAIITQKV